MIRLDLTPGPRWIDLGLGVRVEALPMTATLLHEALADPAMAGVAPTAPAFRPTLSKALARRAIIGWEGVGDADGAAVDPTPERVDALMDLWAFEAQWRRLYVDSLVHLVTEGNASAPSPSGTSGEGAITAADAAPSAGTARH